MSEARPARGRKLRPVDGGFELSAPAQGVAAWRAEAVGEGWTIHGAAPDGPWTMTRVAGPGAGFVLSAAGEGGELGRSSALDGPSGAAELRYLHLADGRMFRMVAATPRHPGFELTGWETAGAYTVARPEADGWSLEPTAAGHALTSAEPLLVLFAVEVLDSDAGLAGHEAHGAD